MKKFLNNLYNEKNYDTLIVKLLDFTNIKKVKEAYPTLNVRVLLTCFTLNLLDEGCEGLRHSSKRLADFLVSDQQDNVNNEYPIFFGYFKEWRSEDLAGLKTEITDAKKNLSEILVEEERDDAETQWNEGVKNNMEIMDNTITLLDKYSKFPPSF